MVTELLYQTDSYLRGFEATVVGVSEAGDGGGPAVALDRTAFYPGGGGQPADQGWLRWHGGLLRVPPMPKGWKEPAAASLPQEPQKPQELRTRAIQRRGPRQP